jgi:tRNA nucleotidyltransferase (CCA-adding enzyme)
MSEDRLELPDGSPEDRLDLVERLRARPGGERLLAAADPHTFLVGGAVRDLLLGRVPRELDVVVEGDAGALAAALGAQVEHPRFGTARVELEGGARIDIAAARRERYAVPGALPEVEPAPLEEDLLRRDFTVNAIALALAGERAGELRAVPDALEDLGARRLRVLHERSFVEDPTRVLRLARYAVRLGFAVGERTAALAGEALAGGALGTVSGARIGAELRLALREPDPVVTLAELERLGVLRALHPRLRCEPALMRRARALLADGAREEGRPDLLLLAVLALPLALRAGDDPRTEIAALLDRLEFTASERERVAAAAAAVPELLERLPAVASPAQLWAVARRVPLEGVALAGALEGDERSERDAGEPAVRRAARRWLQEVRHVRLRIDGGDLLAAGVAQGPEIGRRLEEALRRRLDGELPDERGAQLRAALRM